MSGNVPTDADAALLNERRSELNVLGLLAEFEQRIAHSSFKEIVTSALHFAANHLPISRVSVALLSDDGKGFRVFDATMEIEGLGSGRLLPHGSASLSETVEQQRAIYRADIRAWPHPNPVDDAFIAAGMLCTLSLPLCFGAGCRGTLNVAVPEVDEMDGSVRLFLELIAPRLAHALEMGRALDALAESETRFRLVFEAVGDGLLVADASTGRLIMVNPAIGAMLGRSQGELLGLFVKDLHPKERLDEVLRVFDAMAREDIEQALEIPILRSDGKVFLADITSRRAVLSNRPCLVGMFRDATERRRREQEDLQLQKLESIRTLAAGIAHDFNNLLTGMLGNLSLAQMQIDESHALWELLHEAECAAIRATSLTRQLLTFAKGGAPVRALTNFVQVLRDAASLATSGTNVSCQLELPFDSCAIMGDAGQLTQAFQNLLRNAVDAMPDGGTVCLRLSRETTDALDLLCVEVSDRGSGISLDILDKIYLPFFSTKCGRSGLGLAVASSVVQNHGGGISVQSELGVGATFRVTLPISGSLPEPVVRTRTSPPYGVGRVLVMDDESTVLEVAGRALQMAGYTAIAVTNGADAVDRYREALSSAQRYDAVVLDLTVPGGMGGKEAAERILALDPKARLMVSSGYSDDAIMADYQRNGFSAVLPKPYSAEQLCDAVQTMMARSS